MGLGDRPGHVVKLSPSGSDLVITQNGCGLGDALEERQTLSMLIGKSRGFAQN